MAALGWRTVLPDVPVQRPFVKGVVLNAGNAHAQDVTRVRATWYTTGSGCPLYPGLEAVAGLEYGHEETPPTGNSPYLLTWNECDWNGQSPLDAAIRWREVVEPLYGGALLLSPSVFCWGSGWIPEWHRAYRLRYGRWPRYHGINVHGYSCPGRDVVSELGAAVAWAAQRGKVVWIGEYAAHDVGAGWTHEQATAEARRVLAWVRTQPTIERVAWFNTRTRGDEPWAFPLGYNSPLFEYGSGEMTDWGRLWRN
jgi:hypothetical protein